MVIGLVIGLVWLFGSVVVAWFGSGKFGFSMMKTYNHSGVYQTLRPQRIISLNVVTGTNQIMRSFMANGSVNFGHKAYFVPPWTGSMWPLWDQPVITDFKAALKTPNFMA